MIAAIHRCFLLLLLVMQPVVHAASYRQQQVDSLLRELGADNHFNRNKTIDWGVIPGPFYTPELGFGIGAVIAGIYRPERNDHTSQNSTLTLKAFLSSTGAYGVGFDNYSFFDNDQWRFLATGAIKNIPSYYWGIGYQAGRNNDNKEKYTQKLFQIAPTILYRVDNATYLGFGWDFASSHADVNRRGQQTLFQMKNVGLSSATSGINLRFSYDTRDIIANARGGQYLNISYTHFTPALGSNSRFESVETQYDFYHPLNNKSVLALDLYNRVTFGDTPWERLSELGNDNRMRGYYQGRYRDCNVLSGQLEYRHKLNWRHGYVLWAGAGAMSHGIEALGKGPWLPTIGVGYRFEFKPRMNVRLDFGVGHRSSGFYFQVGEAF